MLKGREIALTLSSSWIMNVVSINVCIINHISTNWTSVEPLGLSDMETCLDNCLFQNKRQLHDLQFSYVGGMQAVAVVRVLCSSALREPRDDCFWFEWASICSISHGKAREMRGKCKHEVVFCLRIVFIVFRRSCYFCQNNTQHKDASDLIIAPNKFIFFTQDCRNVETAVTRGSF